MALNRRTFLGGLLGAAPAGAAFAVGIREKKEQGVTWKCACPQCKRELSSFVDLSGPVVVGTQCPYCLSVLDTSGLAEQIYALNGRDRNGRPLA